MARPVEGIRAAGGGVPAPARPRWVTGSLVAIVLVGAALRILYLVEIRARADFALSGVDATYHHYWARGLVTGDWSDPGGAGPIAIPHTPYFRPPGYPYFLAFIYRVLGFNPLWPRVVQMLMGLANALLAYAVGARWFGRAVGLVWAGLMSCYWVLIFYEGELHEPIPVVTALLLLVVVLGRWREAPRVVAALAAGLLIGAAALFRPNLLLLAPVAATWMVRIDRRRQAARRGAVHAAVVATAAAAAISTATVRNLRVAGDFVLVSANGGVNLFIGNNEEAAGVSAAALPGIGKFQTAFDYPKVVAAVEGLVGRPLRYSEVSSYFTRRALAYIRENPTRTVELTLKKAALFWGNAEIPNNKEIYYERAFSPVLSRLPIGFSVVLGAALVGGGLLAWEARGRRGGGLPVPHMCQPALHRDHGDISILMFAIVLTFFVTLLPFFAADRFRLPIVPLLMGFAACAVVIITRWFAARRFVAAAAAGAGVVGAVLLAGIPLVDMPPQLNRWYMQRGVNLEMAGDFEQALGFYDQAIADWPDDARARLAAADMLRRLSRSDEALPHLHHILQTDPIYFADAHQRLAAIAFSRDRMDEAIVHYAEAARAEPGNLALHLRFAEVLRKAGRVGDAIDQLEAVLTLRPDHADALMAQGMLLHEAGRGEEAEQRFRRAVQLDPTRAAILRASGIVLLPTAMPSSDTASPWSPDAATAAAPAPAVELAQRADRLAEVGRWAQAIELYRRALEADAAHPIIHLQLAQALAATDQRGDAIAHYRRAIELKPDLAAAYLGLGQALQSAGDAAAAAEQYRLAVGIDPRMLAAHYNLGIVLGDGLRRYDEGIAALVKARELAAEYGRDDLVSRIDERSARFREAAITAPNGG